MQERATWAEAKKIVGREDDLARLHGFLDDRSARALVITGVAGIGKTTLWEAGRDAALQRGLRVLTARPNDAEARLPFAALADLLDDVHAATLAGLPPPQLRALEVALLRAEPAGAPPESPAISLGFLNALRTLSAAQPLLIAIDDVQWLDAPSADVLAFAARRLSGEAVSVLLARRPGRPAGVELALEPEHLEVGPLSLGAIRRMLVERLGLTLRRHLLRRLVDSTLGNPLFALEVGRALMEQGVPPIGEELPVPPAVEDLFGRRVSRLRPPVRRLLLAVALRAEPRLAELTGLAGQDALEDAVGAGVLVVDRDRVRASHPLLAAAARKRSRPRQRRELHLELAAAVSDDELRARHLSLAAERPDETLAETVARAAAGASARGARQEAVELAEHALRLTPAGSAARSVRLLNLAGYLDVAGEAQRVTDLLAPALDSLPRGATRARAELLLAEGGGVTSVTDHQRHLESALAEARDDPSLRAHVLARRSIAATVVCVEGVDEAEAAALEAIEALGTADSVDGDATRLALHGLAWARVLAGHPIDDLSERFHAESGAAANLAESTDRVAALRHTWRGEIAAARATLARLLALADERGELWAYAVVRLHLCELELRVGDWDAAARLLDEWAESLETELFVDSSYERCRAALAAGRGQVDEAELWAARVLIAAEATGDRWQVLEALRARGSAELLAHEPLRAAESLRAVWEHTKREGVEDPGAFPVAGDLVEALAAMGELDEARAVAERLRALAEGQAHPRGLAAAKRCDALVRLAAGIEEAAAVAALEEAAVDFGELGLRFDSARTLLLLGRAQRRRKKWAAARKALEQAVLAFEETGSTGWVEEARSELARVGARRPSPPGELSAAERRAAALAADGLTNKEIARALSVSVKTVEGHLSRAYAKLGVRSRAQLARRLERA